MIEVTDKSWNDYKSQDELIILDFWAEWCMPCKTLKKTLSSISDKNCKIATVNTDDNDDLVKEFKIKNLPTLIFYKNGKELKRLHGAQTKRNIEEHILECK